METRAEIHVVLGKTLGEWEKKFGCNDDLWSFPIEEIEDGTIEPNEGMYYWLINGRLYETDEEVLRTPTQKQNKTMANQTNSNDIFATRGTIIPYDVFDEFREDIRGLGHNYISNFTDPNNDHIIIPMPKEELINNMAEKIVDGGYMSEEELNTQFSSHLTDCEVEVSINVKYITITEEKLF